MGKITIKKLWDHYADDVLGTTPHPIKYAETKKAFYSGAVMMIQGIADTLNVDESPEEGAVIKKYAKKVVYGNET